MQKIKITMLGPSGIGKTSLLTAMFNQFMEKFDIKSLQFIPNHQTLQDIEERLTELKSLVNSNNFQAEGGVTQTKEAKSYYFDISQTAINPLIKLHFQDFPGGWIESKDTKEEMQKVEKFLEESSVVIIPIDAAALMEREGRWHEHNNRLTIITNLLQKAYQNLNSPKLVILVPVKCETYMQDKNSELRLLNKVKEKYSELLDVFRISNLAKYVSIVVTPVQTVGNLKFSRIEGENEGEPQFYFRQTQRNVPYAPKDAEQPLQYIFSFCLKLHAEQNLFPAMNFMNNLVGIDNNPFKQAALQVARERKNTGGFAVLQGQNWLDI